MMRDNGGHDIVEDHRLMAARTVIRITHRPASLDRVLRLQDGRLAAPTEHV